MNLREKYPLLREVLNMNLSKNPFQCWNFCVDKLREFIEFNITKFNIRKISEKKFVEKVNKIVREYEKIQEKVNEVNKEIMRKKLFSMRVVELKNLCKERGLKGYSKLKKEELLELISDNQ